MVWLLDILYVPIQELQIPQGKPHNMHKGAIPRRPPIIQNGNHQIGLTPQLSQLSQFSRLPQGKPHAMHNNAIPRRPPMKNSSVNLDCSSNFDDDRKSSVGSIFN